MDPSSQRVEDQRSATLVWRWFGCIFTHFSPEECKLRHFAKSFLCFSRYVDLAHALQLSLFHHRFGFVACKPDQCIEISSSIVAGQFFSIGKHLQGRVSLHAFAAAHLGVFFGCTIHLCHGHFIFHFCGQFSPRGRQIFAVWDWYGRGSVSLGLHIDTASVFLSFRPRLFRMHAPVAAPRCVELHEGRFVAFDGGGELFLAADAHHAFVVELRPSDANQRRQGHQQLQEGATLHLLHVHVVLVRLRMRTRAKMRTSKWSRWIWHAVVGCPRSTTPSPSRSFPIDRDRSPSLPHNP